MNSKLDAETLKIPAYLRKKMIISQSRQKLILTALDRKEAGLKYDSTKALAPVKPQGSSKTVITRSGQERRQAISSVAGLPIVELSGSFAKIGEVTGYLDKIGVAIIKLVSPIKIGQKILVQGNNEIFVQEVREMQIDRKPVKKASSGAHIGMKVKAPAATNGFIYRLSS